MIKWLFFNNNHGQCYFYSLPFGSEKMKKQQKNELILLIHHLCQYEPIMIHPLSSTEKMLRFSRKVNGFAQQQCN
jgi:hypothetical protein